MPRPSRLADKSVLITGGSSGIGAALAREAARRGARVGLLARREKRLRQLAAELSATGAQAAWARGDVTDGEGLHRALDALAAELGGADVLVANAGYAHPEYPQRCETGSALKLYDTNLLGALRTIDWALPRFLEAGSGHLVGMASIASFLGFPNSASYCGGKAAMRIHLQSLRVSLKSHGIAVTTVCPGYVKSELTQTVSYRMPLLWETDRAARKIADAIERRRGELIFPWQLGLAVETIRRLLPTTWTERLMARFANPPERVNDP